MYSTLQGTAQRDRSIKALKLQNTNIIGDILVHRTTRNMIKSFFYVFSLKRSHLRRFISGQKKRRVKDIFKRYILCFKSIQLQPKSCQKKDSFGWHLVLQGKRLFTLLFCITKIKLKPKPKKLSSLITLVATFRISVSQLKCEISSWGSPVIFIIYLLWKYTMNGAYKFIAQGFIIYITFMLQKDIVWCKTVLVLVHSCLLPYDRAYSGFRLSMHPLRYTRS